MGNKDTIYGRCSLQAWTRPERIGRKAGRQIVFVFYFRRANHPRVRPPVTLQINLAPSDARHAEYLLPHQVARWGGQVDEILLVVDLHRSKGRFSVGWEEGKQRIGAIAAAQTGARVIEVDYTRAARQRVADEFFGGRPVPEKDFRGGPYYSYFFGLNAARHDQVLHSDSDLFYGGGSQDWIAEAEALFRDRPDVVFASPLPGPPAADARLHSQRAEADPHLPNAFRFSAMSTRVFFLSRSRLRERIGVLRPEPPPAWRDRIRAIVESNPSADLPEHLISQAMLDRGLHRVDFLGSGAGMWTLHPPFRGTDFYTRLPQLIQQVETGDVPAEQRGCHDMNASMVDWSEGLAALRQNRWWRRHLPVRKGRF